MTLRMLLMLLLAVPVIAGAQPAFYLDLSGDWRMTPLHEAKFAAPEMDDSGWAVMRLPIATVVSSDGAGMPRGGWLRKTVRLPEWVDRGQLTLTLGAIRERYAVYVNGHEIGMIGSLDTFSNAEIVRPHSFAIPREAFANSRDEIVVAIHLGQSPGAPTTMRPTDEGPYLLSDRTVSPVRAGAQALTLWRQKFTPTLIIAAIYLLLSLPLVAAWWGDRTRTELLLLATFLLISSFSLAHGFLVINPEARPWAYGPYPLVQLMLRSGTYVGLTAFLVWSFEELARTTRPGSEAEPRFSAVVGSPGPVRAFGERRKWLYGLLVLSWAVLPILVFVGGANRAQVYNYYRGSQAIWALLPWAVMVKGWMNFENQRGYLTVLAAPMIERTISGLTYIFGGQSVAQTLSGFEAGGYRFSFGELLPLGLAGTVLVALLRQVGQDRQDRLRLQGEMDSARVAQQFLLGQNQAVESSGYRIDPVYESSLEVGGDLYQILDRPDGVTLLLVGDVSGKGLRAAMMASLLCGAMRRDESLSPRAVLAGLNRMLDGRTGGGFVTCCCLRLDPDGRLTIANAGHLNPYIEGREVELESGLPLGVVPEADYREREIALPADGQLTVISDGVVEAANEKGELFGFDRTREISGKSAQEIADAAKDWGQNDDITVVTIRRIASSNVQKRDQ